MYSPPRKDVDLQRKYVTFELAKKKLVRFRREFVNTAVDLTVLTFSEYKNKAFAVSIMILGFYKINYAL